MCVRVRVRVEGAVATLYSAMKKDLDNKRTFPKRPESSEEERLGRQHLSSEGSLHMSGAGVSPGSPSNLGGWGLLERRWGREDGDRAEGRQEPTRAPGGQSEYCGP